MVIANPIVNVLHHSGTDPEEKKKLEVEQEAWRTVNALLDDQRNQYLKSLKEKDQALSEKEKVISEKEKVISEKDQALYKLQKEIEALKSKLGE